MDNRGRQAGGNEFADGSRRFGRRPGFRQGLILRLHLRRGGVQIQIRRKGQLHISGNALHPRPDQQGKRQIGVAKRIGSAKLRPAVLPFRRRNPDQLGAVLRRPGDIPGRCV